MHYAVPIEFSVHLKTYGDDTWPWVVSIARYVGSKGAMESYEDLDEFRSFYDALRDARRRCQDAAAFAGAKPARAALKKAGVLT
jgi:hypothetical protein